MSLNSEPPVSPKPTSPPILKLLRPGIACPPGMPIDALGSPIPAQSVGIVWNLTCEKPTRNSLTVLVLTVRAQLNATLKNGESLVAINWLAIGARSGSDLYFCADNRPNIRSFAE